MIDLILRAKHWQIFSLLAVPALLQLIFQFSAFPFNSESGLANSEAFVLQFKNMMSVSVIFGSTVFILFFAWLWSVAIGLNKKLSPEIAAKTLYFKICTVLIAISYTFIFFLMFKLFDLFSQISSDNALPDDFFSLFISLFMLIPIVFGCFIYIYGFVAKAIVASEKNGKVKVSDYIPEFFLIYFFPIGIWFLQPRINKLVGEGDE